MTLRLPFDLDGTLTDPGLGITRCLQHAIARLGRPVPPAETLRRFVGPPLRASFMELIGAEGQLKDAIALYGSELSGANADKGDLIRHALAAERFGRPPGPWMVGDRIHDVEAARRNGLAAIAVLWGYGTESELRDARPDHMVASMQELCELVAAQSLLSRRRQSER